MQRNRYHHLEWLYGIDFFEAAFSTQTFSRHAHEGFAIGAIAEGAGGYLCRGESMVLPAGSLSLMNPEEAHTGHAAAERVRYNMLYASEAAVRAVLGVRTLRGFAEIAPRDRDYKLSQALVRLAECLNSAQMADHRLAVEEAVHAVLATAFALYGRAVLRQPGNEPAAIRTMLGFIEDGLVAGEALSLTDMAAAVGLNPSYLIRSTVRATGLTPRGHVLRARLNHARRLLLDGAPAAEAAIAAGFYDQAHLIRHFRRHYGVTPGALIRH
ncbi:AraC family transcriptional regulator [Martelella mediterranea]|uniref:AraC family transcriptional regulator n=1 Tax=Martelella mediterranea TaxID=293089 RepID=A0A4R3NG72_9HYPH|nr:AraC family transcriptional regulator [Martelella mediterranea]TCT31716.1 AraC family transcriptional regulator [Martelella mediterranea]